MSERTRKRYAFPAGELPPGARRVLQAGRREVAVFNVAGELRAVFNRCPHQQAPLHTGPLGGTQLPCDDVGETQFGLDGQVLRCPWHHYEFDLTTGRCLADPKRLRVATYDVRREGDDIAVYV